MRFNLKSFGHDHSTKYLWIKICSGSFGFEVTEEQNDNIRLLDGFKRNLRDHVGIESLEFRKEVTRDLSEFLSKNHLKNIQATLILSSELVNILSTTFPAMSESNLRKATLLSLVSKDDASRNDVCFDLIYSPSIKNKQTVNVVAASIGKKDIQDLVQSIEETGCIVRKATVSIIEYGEKPFNSEESGENNLVIDVGRESSGFMFYTGAKPISYKKENRISEKQILEAVDKTILVNSKPFRLNQDEAQTLIREYGIAFEEGEDKLTGKEMPLFQLHSMLRPYVERLVLMIRNSISRFLKEYEADKVSRIFLIGQGNYIKGLPEFIEKKLGLPVISEPLVQDAFPDEKAELVPQETRKTLNPFSTLSAAQHINLLPNNVLFKRHLSVFARIGFLLLVVFFAFMVFLYTGMVKQTGKYAGILSGTKGIESPDTKIQTMSKELDGIQARIQWYKNTMAGLSPSLRWFGLMGDIGKLIPPNMRINECSINRQNSSYTVKITGVKFNIIGGTAGSAFEFAESLKASPFVGSVLHVSQDEKKNPITQIGVLQFEITCTLKEVPTQLMRSSIMLAEAGEVLKDD